MKPRKITELLQILYNNSSYIKRGICLGICCLIIKITRSKKITIEESEILDSFVRNHRPKRGEKFFSDLYGYSAYFWKTKDWSVRREWIEYQIGLLKEDKNGNS